MTCEDEPSRLTWEIQMHEPFSGVWINKGWGRATTTATPLDIARAVLAGYLTAQPARPGETFRAMAYTETSSPIFVTADQLADDGAALGPAVREALPVHLRDALQTG